MKNGKNQDPNVIHPIAGYDKEIYVKLLLKFKWWDKRVEEINSLIPILTCSDLEKVREEIEARL